VKSAQSVTKVMINKAKDKVNGNNSINLRTRLTRGIMVNDTHTRRRRHGENQPTKKANKCILYANKTTAKAVFQVVTLRLQKGTVRGWMSFLKPNQQKRLKL